MDLVQLHSCSLDVLKRGDAIAALETARERGWTRFIGYSGDGAAAKWAVESGRFDTLQTSVSIADQEALDLTLPVARQREMGVIAKRPIANVAWRYARKPAEPYYQDYWERLRALDYPVPARQGDGGGTHRAPLHPGHAGRAHRHRGHDQAGSLAGERHPARGRRAAGRRARGDPRPLENGGPTRLGRPDLTGLF